MTLDTALTISSLRAVDLWRISHDHGGGSPDTLREQALDILTTEVERLRAMRCETCVHQKVSHGVGWPPGTELCDNGHALLTCASVGNRCGAWTPRTEGTR